MNGEPIPSQREAVLAKLNASIDSFFQAGGAIQSLPTSGYVPHRPHRAPERAEAHERPAKASRKKVREPGKRTAQREQRIAEVRELAKRMTYAEARAHTGLSMACLGRYALEGGFKFKPDPNRGKGNLGKQLTDPAKDKALAERITAMRDVGVTMSQVCRHLEISYTQIHRLMRLFDIKFPTTAEKRAQRKA
ncbi:MULTISPECIES: hypothetical protein [unclassified Pseudomonas]|uniref:hypothetical protein n=1 Tax=unclassified Pseudomonas TaxID=196821 RepID=UPI002447E3C8|nr:MULTISPECIES: hypothetical protein [unclassified Pseudomonas]MDH0300654.1 hypothetical protein [Pseudomonas sp. GD04091]MDH1984195.1 hypothetical protein [Pseudomonas sp. GD03689]